MKTHIFDCNLDECEPSNRQKKKKKNKIPFKNRVCVCNRARVPFSLNLSSVILMVLFSYRFD